MRVPKLEEGSAHCHAIHCKRCVEEGCAEALEVFTDGQILQVWCKVHDEHVGGCLAQVPPEWMFCPMCEAEGKDAAVQNAARSMREAFGQVIQEALDGERDRRESRN